MDLKMLRNLLLDCRAALRRHVGGFEETPLREVLDDGIIELGQAGDTAAAEAMGEPETQSSHQVALAWQAAARDLRYTHPELHAKLSARVLQVLDVDVLHDPAAEIQELETNVRDGDAALRSATGELTELREALAHAVPILDDPRLTGHEATRQRLRQLIEAATRGGGLPRPKPEDPADIALTQDELRAVAAGRRALTPDERDWCMGEALVRTGFQHTPVQLIERGEPALAQLILDPPTSA